MLRYILLSLLFASFPADLMAASYPITYSWSGTISPIYPQNDPWSLGALGQPFSLSFTLASDAQGETYSSLSPLVIFHTAECSLVINGKSIPMSPTIGNGVGTIEFLEPYYLDSLRSDPYDQIIFTAIYQINGITGQLISTPQLPPDTFHVTSLSVPSIPFGDLHTVDESVGAIGTYQMYVPNGATISIVPEPSRIRLLLIFGASVFATGRRRADASIIE